MSLPAHDSSEALQEFATIGETMQNLASRLGVSLRIFNENSEPRFSKLQKSDQQSVLQRLQIFKSLWQQAVQMEEKGEGLEERKLLWLAFRTLGLVPPSDLLNQLQDGDVFEVYVGERQVYRSFNYYNLASYSLDELESQPWPELFHRDDAGILAEILAECTKTLTERKIVWSQTPPHIVSETSSALQHRISYQLKFLCPLRDSVNSRQDCFIAVIRAERASTLTEDERRERIRLHQEKQLHRQAISSLK